DTVRLGPGDAGHVDDPVVQVVVEVRVAGARRRLLQDAVVRGRRNEKDVVARDDVEDRPSGVGEAVAWAESQTLALCGPTLQDRVFEDVTAAAAREPIIPAAGLEEGPAFGSVGPLRVLFRAAVRDVAPDVD